MHQIHCARWRRLAKDDNSDFAFNGNICVTQYIARGRGGRIMEEILGQGRSQASAWAASPPPNYVSPPEFADFDISV